MTSADQLSALLARVEAAEGPDRIIELDLHDALLGRLNRGPFSPEDGSRIPHFTASLDASLALCSRVLPGWQWSIVGPDMEMKPFVRLFSHNFRGEEAETEGATPPLAMIAAMLKALIAKAIGAAP